MGNTAPGGKSNEEGNSGHTLAIVLL